MKEDVVVTQTITVNSTEEHVVVLMILWAGFLVATGVTAWHVFKSKTPEGEGSSSGDTSRALFYRLLGIALLSRSICIPILIRSNGSMLQLVADTLPILCFASAWAVLVFFFVQLVATASGTPPNNTPSLVIYMVALCMYTILVVTYWWYDTAAVLLYALLCCLYATLFCALVYFGPKLVALLKPSLERQSRLGIRLVACCTVGVTVFLLQAIQMARTVVAPPLHSMWWFVYGILELLPSSLLLIMMHPTKMAPDTPQTSGMRRIGSASSNRSGETSSLLKPVSTVQYGSKGEP